MTKLINIQLLWFCNQLNRCYKLHLKLLLYYLNIRLLYILNWPKYMIFKYQLVLQFHKQSCYMLCMLPL